MKFEIFDKKIEDIEADFEVVFVKDKNLLHKWIKDRESLSLLKFKGESEQVATVIENRRIYISIDSFDHEELRLATAKAIKVLKKLEIKSIKIGSYSCGESANIRAIAEGFILGNYEYDRYKTKKSETSIETILISLEDYSDKNCEISKCKDALNSAEIIAESVNFVRDIVNTPPDDATPIKLAEIAQNLANETSMECRVEDESYLEKEGMGAFLAVSRASVHPPRLIHLTHKHPEAKARITLVGKGLTYDSGGLSLKPADYMATMKADKGGGSAVIGIMRAINKLNLPLEVHGIIGATENMIGGNAYKPDDVLVAKNGKTIEIKNTDAEGRLVLADCLCYAQDLEPDYIIDMATLTGACVVALGEYSYGIMGNNDELKHSMFEASKACGELSCEMHFNRFLKKLLKTEVADICNISNTRYGGALTAGIFLSEFIKEENRDKWLHLDIAGPAFVEKEWGYNPYGASGAGVRSVVEWLSNLSKES